MKAKLLIIQIPSMKKKIFMKNYKTIKYSKVYNYQKVKKININIYLKTLMM